MMRVPTFVWVLSLAVLTSSYAHAANDGQWYRCIVKASSHLGKYTFKISTTPCDIYWLEIDTHLKISECQAPILSGLKPSAQDKYSVVWFNLETGDFYDYLSGVKDRGICTKMAQKPEK